MTSRRPRVYPTCPTHELLMYELAKEAAELSRILTQWRGFAGSAARHAADRQLAATQPELRLRVPHQDTMPAKRKARTS